LPSSRSGAGTVSLEVSYMSVGSIQNEKESFFFGAPASYQVKRKIVHTRHFNRKAKIRIEKDNFLIKTAESDEEVYESLRLRHDAIYRELRGLAPSCPIDFDRYDHHSDHLLIIDKTSNSISATYRLTCSLHAREFPLEKEFDIGRLLKKTGIKLELGKACLAKSYRNSNMIGILWTGLEEYCKVVDVRYIFGCSNVMTTDPLRIAMLHRFFSYRYAAPEDLRVFPRGNYRLKMIDKYVDEIGRSKDLSDYSTVETTIPSIIKSHLMAGAVVCGEPALNVELKCADFLTLLDIRTWNKPYIDIRTGRMGSTS
jgi:putative hemolysin